MALNLSDFNNKDRSKEEMRMEAFQPRTKPSPAANASTINTIATLGAALDPSGNLDGAYKAITNQLSFSTSSNTLDAINQSWDQNDVQGSMDQLRTILVNPDIPDQEKQNILYGFQTNQNPPSLGVKVAISAAEADSEGETIEGSELRAAIAAGYDEVDSYHAWAQQQINALNSEETPAFQDNVKLLAESFLPFLDAADAAMFENIVGVEGTGGVGNSLQTLFIMGEGKNRIREALDRVPVEERKPVVQALISTIKSMSGTITTNTTTLRAIRNLEQMISVNGYSQTDRWADDFFSVLDATVLLSPLRKTLSATGDVFKAATGAQLDTEILRRGALAQEAQQASTGPITDPTRLLEWKPTAPDYATDVDSIIESIPSEIFNRNQLPSQTSINQIRTVISDELANGDGFSIDNVIDRLSITDNMTSQQVLDLRASMAPIQIKRRNQLNGVIPDRQGDLPEVQRAHISGNTQPTSVSQIYKDTNPAKARAAHEIVVRATDNRAAEVLYGTDRTSALSNDILPDVGGGNRIRHKTEFDEVAATPDKNIIQHIDDADGAVWASRKEKAAAKKSVINEWKNVNGLTSRSAMQTISTIKPEATELGNGIRFNQVFGPKENGFSDALAGMEYVKAALRKYGIKDSELTVLSRQPDGLYGPVRDGQDLRNGDFVVQVQHDYKYDPSEIGYDGFDVSPLWKFIPIPDVKALTREGGVTQMVIPKSVNIDKNAYTAGVSAADKASGLQKQMLEYGKRVADGFKKLGKQQQSLVDQYIRIANDEEIVFNAANIRAAGISEDGLKVLNDWKTVQDTIWVLENRDVNRTLRNRGYEYFVNKATDTQLLIKQEARGSAVYGRDYLLPDGKVGKMTNTELDELYAGGGYIGSLRKAEDFNGETVTHVVVKNNATEGYGRRIRDDDTTLGYRDGYYHVRYTDPYYITVKSPDGTTKTIARAETRKDAEAELMRLRTLKDGNEYDWKYDRNIGMDARFDDELDVQFNSGRSSQRLRGKRLTRVGHDKTLSDAGMESPIDSLVRSIASISNRVAFRDVLEADKRRWITSFKGLLPANESYKFPETIDAIRSGPGANEARHAWRYIQGLQDGYANLLDDASKMFFNWSADVASSKGWGWVEKVGRTAARANPSSAARLTAFRLFLAANPLRQLPLQMAPAIPIIASLNPQGFVKVFRQAPVLGAWHRGVDAATTLKISKMSGLSVDEMNDLIKDYELSGMSAAVNAHSYLADDLARLADRNVVQRAATIAGTPLKVAQKAGFDLGEQTLMTTVWISERDRMLRRLGKKSLDATEREELTAKVRAITGDMNRGGDMPYNSNSFSVIMQFLQNPHKIASGLILGHRNLTVSERARLIAGYTVTFGVPTVFFVDQFVDGILPPEKVEQRELIKGGMANLLLNRFLTSLSGEDTNVDFSGSLQPFSTEPLTEFVGGLITGTIPEMLAGSAAPSLLSDGGRIRNFIEAVAAPFVPGNYENVDEYKQIGLTFLQLFTGLSNTMKAQYMLESGKIVTAKGQVVDDDISHMEALMKAAGFQTMDEVQYWAGNKLAWEASDQLDNDIKQLVDGLFGLYTRENLSVSDMKQYQSVMAEASRVFNGNVAIMNKVADYYKMKIRSNPDDLYRTLFRNSGLYDPADIPRIINNSNLSEDQIKTLMEMYKITGESYGR
jgi:hypothetical protein